MKKNKNGKRRGKLNIQKAFCFISFGILISCLVFYGFRFFRAYSKYHVKKEDSNALVTELLTKSLRKVDDNYYFYNDTKENYIEYANMTWRILKVNKSKTITLVSEDIVTSLAYGEDISSFSESNINKWLNNIEDSKGKFETNITTSTPLSKTGVCIDKLDKTTKKSCKDEITKNTVGIPSLEDYINTGSSKGFMNNGEYYYLSNETKDNKIWYVAGDNLDTTDGSEILGVKATITLPATTKKVSGKGTSNSPYIIENENSLFGSYVSLGDNLWRIYNVNDTTVDLVLMDNIDAESGLYYSNSNKYNTNIKSTYAYYLNHNYIRNLSYNTIINTNEWNNGYYGASNDYVVDPSQSTAKAQIGLLSIGDIFLNLDIDSFSTMTKEQEDGELVYIINNNGTGFLDSNDSSNNIVATININKDMLKSGKGTKDSPYGME